MILALRTWATKKAIAPDTIMNPGKIIGPIN
jgi:FAD/FMN-containing dehydrogenase